MGGFICDVFAAEAFDHIEGHVDTRSDARRGNNTVIYPSALSIDCDTGIKRTQEIQCSPVRSGPAAFQKAGLRQ
jgi:hypothetical protein